MFGSSLFGTKLLDLFQSGYFFFTFDLKSGYHTSKFVLIIASIWVFLGGSIQSSNTLFLMFLPFGLSSAPYIFTKLVCAFVNYWRGLGRRVITSLVDGIGGSPDFASCQELSRFCHSDLDSAGFFVNLQKFVWEPSQVGAWLGFFSLNNISVPHSKIKKLQGSISRVLALRIVNA